MPTLQPPGGPVDWPSDEGVLGVVGVAPWATLDFLRAFYAGVSATKDWHFPRVIADINTKLPSRGRHLDLGETDPSPFIQQTIAELAAQGATVVVVPCNTAHLLYDRWVSGATVSVPHIVEVTAAAVRSAGARRVAALTSASLRRSALFDRAMESAGLEPVGIDDRLSRAVTQAIGEVKRHAVIGPETLGELRQLLGALHRSGVDGLVLGCTELASLQAEAERVGFTVAESNAALAQASRELVQSSLV
jgi:aspartate racemase